MRARDYRHQAWSALSGRWGTMILIFVIVSIITGACGGLSWLGVGAIALLLITGPLSLGVAIANLKLIRGENVEIGDTFSGFKNFGNAFILSLLNEIFIALWSILLVIPGIIASYRYAMSFYILADNPGMDGNTARKKSIEMMRGNKWRLFCLDLSFIGWWLLCILTFGILTFWVSPYEQAARAEFYQDLVNGQNGGSFAQQFDKASAPETPNQPQSGESAFGTGYEANPDMELNNEAPASQPENTDKSDDGDAPLNADDL